MEAFEIGIYGFRRAVPADLETAVGKREEKFSLGTKDPALAKQRHHEASVAVDQRCARLRLKPEVLTVAEAIKSRNACTTACSNNTGPNRRLRDFGISHAARSCGAAGASQYTTSQLRSEFIQGTSDPHSLKRRAMKHWCEEQAKSYVASSGHILDAEGLSLLARSIGSAMKCAAEAIKALEPYDFAARSEPPSSQISATQPRAASTPISFEHLLQGWASEKRPREKQGPCGHVSWINWLSS